MSRGFHLYRRAAGLTASPPGNLDCAWCGKKHGRYSKSGQHPANCCSPACDGEYVAHNCVSKATIDARIANAQSQPKGFATIDDFLANGGRVYREDRKPW